MRSRRFIGLIVICAVGGALYACSGGGSTVANRDMPSATPSAASAPFGGDTAGPPLQTPQSEPYSSTDGQLLGPAAQGGPGTSSPESRNASPPSTRTLT